MANKVKLLSSRKKIAKDTKLTLFINSKGKLRRVILLDEKWIARGKLNQRQVLTYQFIGKSGFPSTKKQVREYHKRGLEVSAEELFSYP